MPSGKKERASSGLSNRGERHDKEPVRPGDYTPALRGLVQIGLMAAKEGTVNRRMSDLHTLLVIFIGLAATFAVWFGTMGLSFLLH